MRDIAPDHAAPPDLPAELLRQLPDAGLDLGPVAETATSPPGPDLPAELLTAAPTAPDSVTAPSGPDLTAAMLMAYAPPAREEPPIAAPPIDMPTVPPAMEPADDADLGPPASMPLAEDLIQLSDDLSFEEKWNSLARRLQEGGPAAEEVSLPAPPDLPEELLRSPDRQRLSAELDSDENE